MSNIEASIEECRTRGGSDVYLGISQDYGDEPEFVIVNNVEEAEMLISALRQFIEAKKKGGV